MKNSCIHVDDEIVKLHKQRNSRAFGRYRYQCAVNKNMWFKQIVHIMSCLPNASLSPGLNVPHNIPLHSSLWTQLFGHFADFEFLFIPDKQKRKLSIRRIPALLCEIVVTSLVQQWVRPRCGARSLSCRSGTKCLGIVALQSPCEGHWLHTRWDLTQTPSLVCFTLFWATAEANEAKWQALSLCPWTGEISKGTRKWRCEWTAVWVRSRVFKVRGNLLSLF